MVIENSIVPIREDWQQALQSGVSDVAELLQILGITEYYPAEKLAQMQQFPLRVPRGFVARMQRKNPNDPLLLQVLPQTQELQEISGFSLDPLQEKHFNPVPGLLHKYRNRVLLTAAASCPIHCRYCFRRYFPYDENSPGQIGWQAAFNYIAANPEIEEVILSGGDPLLLKDNALRYLLKNIAAISHIKRLRFHSRIPIVLPERITATFTQVITSIRLPCVMVVHCNHPQEIDSAVSVAIAQLRHAGIAVFNQSVLLKNINDDVNILATLSEKLFSIGVIPYYLHVLDKVQGATHFEVKEIKAKKIMQALRERLSGYLVPRLVKEEAGAFSKTII